MTAFLQVRRGGGVEMIPLSGEVLVLGRHPGCDVVFPDESVSRRHARLEAVAGGWCVQDIGSSGGTKVGGQAVTGVRALRDGDELRLGEFTVVFRSYEPAEQVGETLVDRTRPPTLTPRERDVLVALCRPIITSGDLFTEPASQRAIAAELVVGEPAVKQHLLRLYEKFGLHSDESGRRRVQLANEAVRRGAVSMADLA